MSWMMYALIAPVFFAMGNVFDKIIIKDIDSKSYAIFVMFTYLLYMPLVLIIKPVSSTQLLIGFLNGFLHCGAIFAFLYAIKIEDVSIILMLIQLTPITTALAGFVILGDIIGGLDILAFAIILLGALLVIYAKVKHNLNRSLPLILTLIAALTISNIMFKITYNNMDLAQGMFLFAVGHLPFTLLLLSKKTFKTFVKNIHGKNLPLLMGINAIYTVALICLNIAFVDGTAAIIAVLGSFSVVFAFIFVIIANKIKPNIIDEHLDRFTVIRKAIAMFIMLIGLFILNI